ncbi:hypothetical protein [Christiangramia sp. OXR-203]|uniref:hypothetical protein n=1 Tax=Christiangramia sp. OXR-203 TaxID=3100176 RepID=UPI002AC89F79|nr:hypothetical protein [Christiangramia sp. OXR-203]WPY97067.1 hypothetical protein T8I65_07720 [Christiangramia sp. OXR-203]
MERLTKPIAEIELKSGAHFDLAEIYDSTNQGNLYIIPSDNQRYIYPAKEVPKLPKGQIFPCIVLAGEAELIGYKAQCIDDGGGNNYLVELISEDGMLIEYTQEQIIEFSNS